MKQNGFKMSFESRCVRYFSNVLRETVPCRRSCVGKASLSEFDACPWSLIFAGTGGAQTSTGLLVWLHVQYNKINAAAILQAIAGLLQNAVILFNYTWNDTFITSHSTRDADPVLSRDVIQHVHCTRLLQFGASFDLRDLRIGWGCAFRRFRNGGTIINRFVLLSETCPQR